MVCARSSKSIRPPKTATRLISRLPLFPSPQLVLRKMVPAWAWGCFGCKQQCCSKSGAARLSKQSFRKGRIRRRAQWMPPLQGWVHSCFPGLPHSLGSGVALDHRVTPCSQPSRCAVSHRHHPSEPGWVTPAPSRSRNMCPGTERWGSRSLASPECYKIK